MSMLIALSLVPLLAESPGLDLLDMDGRWVEVKPWRRLGYGSPFPPIRLEVRGDVFAFRRDAGEEAFKLINYDPTTRPRSLDLDTARRGDPASFIYRLYKDRLMLCWSSNGTGRPTAFREDRHRGWSLLVLRRERTGDEAR